MDTYIRFFGDFGDDRNLQYTRIICVLFFLFKEKGSSSSSLIAVGVSSTTTTTINSKKNISRTGNETTRVLTLLTPQGDLKKHRHIALKLNVNKIKDYSHINKKYISKNGRDLRFKQNSKSMKHLFVLIIEVQGFAFL